MPASEISAADRIIHIYEQSSKDKSPCRYGNHTLKNIPTSFEDKSLRLFLYGAWGTGKTYYFDQIIFSKLLEIGKKEEDIIYINAFESDFIDGAPLGFLMSILKSCNQDNSLKKIRKEIKKFAPRLIRYGLSFIPLGSSEILFNNEETKDDSIGELADLIKEISTYLKGKIIVIDELDRCIPKNTIDFLETIKFLFNTESFFLFIGCKDALKRSINKIFGIGHNNNDSEKYLDKFFLKCIPFVSSLKEKINFHKENLVYGQIGSDEQKKYLNSITFRDLVKDAESYKNFIKAILELIYKECLKNNYNSEGSCFSKIIEKIKREESFQEFYNLYKNL